MQEETELLHSIPSDPLTGAISVPIYQTSTFVQEAPGLHKGFDYARTNNPTRRILEETLAKLENGAVGCAFASGLAAIDAVLKMLSSGDEIVAVDDIYGGSFRLFTHVYKKLGINVRYVDTSDTEKVVATVNEKTKLVWLETPTNPTLKISDINTISEIAHGVGALCVVDNTFASPVLQRPLELGADIVVHSATKYLGGHSDLVAGIVVARDPVIGERLRFIQNASGGILGPFDSWLVIRGLATLHLRVKYQNQTAFEIARFLCNHPAVEKVYYPGLENHRNHDLALKQQRGNFGAMVSFSLKEDSIEAAKRLVTSTSLFKLAESLGGTKSLICHPPTMTHKSIPDETRRAIGINDSLIRLSVGLEEKTDLIEDLNCALYAESN